MSLMVRTALATLVVVSPGSLPAGGSQTTTVSGAKSDRVNACSLLPREEVRKLVPWPALLDRMPTEEEPIGTSGSSCNYPTVFIQVLPYSPSWLDSARKQGSLEPVAGVGDEAQLRNNGGEYVELYTKVGSRLLTIQKDIGPGQTFETEKPVAIKFAKVLVTKLR